MDLSSQPKLWVKDIQFSDGTIVEMLPASTLAIVGPNNAGKSAALRAIRAKIRDPRAQSPVVSSLSVEREGSPECFSAWMAQVSVINKGARGQVIYASNGETISHDVAMRMWASRGLGDLGRWFCHILNADERLAIGNPAPQIVLTHEAPRHPIHYMQRDDVVESRLSDVFRKAFNADLVVHRNAGRHVPLLVGDRPKPLENEDRLSRSYLTRLEQLSPLHEQGDGMRSFAGVVMAISVNGEAITLIDEPEAFLHPPQARLMGTALVQQGGRGRQLLVATHSGDVLRGMLDVEAVGLKVVRLRRVDGVLQARILDSDSIKDLWSDPILRYSNILDGLFHDSVVIAESDSDCRFYTAVLDAVVARQDSDVRRPDIQFTHCGGKDRLNVVVAALCAVGVPVKVIADFDILNAEQPLRKVVEAFGRDWSEVEADWKLVRTAIDGKKADLDRADVRRRIVEALDSSTDRNVDGSTQSVIYGIMKRSSPWAHAKEGGIQFVPPGEPNMACSRLLKSLREIGVYVVPVGEVESFDRSVGNHGPKWVNGVLQKDVGAAPELAAARRFVQDIVDATL